MSRLSPQINYGRLLVLVVGLVFRECRTSTFKVFSGLRSARSEIGYHSRLHGITLAAVWYSAVSTGQRGMERRFVQAADWCSLSGIAGGLRVLPDRFV